MTEKPKLKKRQHKNPFPRAVVPPSLSQDDSIKTDAAQKAEPQPQVFSASDRSQEPASRCSSGKIEELIEAFKKAQQVQEGLWVAKLSWSAK